MLQKEDELNETDSLAEEMLPHYSSPPCASPSRIAVVQRVLRRSVNSSTGQYTKTLQISSMPFTNLIHATLLLRSPKSCPIPCDQKGANTTQRVFCKCRVPEQGIAR